MKKIRTSRLGRKKGVLIKKKECNWIEFSLANFSSFNQGCCYWTFSFVARPAPISTSPLFGFCLHHHESFVARCPPSAPRSPIWGLIREQLPSYSRVLWIKGWAQKAFFPCVLKHNSWLMAKFENVCTVPNQAVLK